MVTASSLLLLTAAALAGSEPSTSPQRGTLSDGFNFREVRRLVVCSNPCRVRKNNRLHRQVCGKGIMPRMTQKGCKQFSNTFREFKGYGIRKHNYRAFFKLTITQCRMKCLKAEVFCKSFEFNPFSKLAANCYVSSSGFKEVAAVFREINLKYWTFMSRNCERY